MGGWLARHRMIGAGMASWANFRPKTETYFADPAKMFRTLSGIRR